MYTDNRLQQLVLLLFSFLCSFLVMLVAHNKDNKCEFFSTMSGLCLEVYDESVIISAGLQTVQHYLTVLSIPEMGINEGNILLCCSPSTNYS